MADDGGVGEVRLLRVSRRERDAIESGSLCDGSVEGCAFCDVVRSWDAGGVVDPRFAEIRDQVRAVREQLQFAQRVGIGEPDTCHECGRWSGGAHPGAAAVAEALRMAIALEEEDIARAAAGGEAAPAGGVGSSVGLRETIETQVRVSNPEHWRLDDVELTDAAIGHAVRRIVEREAAERNDG